MPAHALDPDFFLGLALLAIPLAYGLAAMMPLGPVRDPVSTAWRRAARAAASGFVLALVAAGAVAVRGAGIFRIFGFGAGRGGADALPALRLDLRLDDVGAVMLVLVAFIGLVILQFSRRYLDGDPGQVRYVRWFLATLATVSLLVLANHLVLVWLAWLGTSIALHQLLTFYDDRAPALIAAHKKFITSRLADACLLGAIALVAGSFGSADLDVVFARLDSDPRIADAPGVQVAALLFAAAAALKCAQLPFHGWLLQVMEAPTPVSALLHAGVVNLGGFLMIRLAPLIVEVEAAQLLLVVVGSLTAAIASLVMTTRVSIKVALAWSTCAQMGFMLLECGLGAWSLALLHLVAHSLYKAHAFLSSGSAVDVWRLQQQAPPVAKSGLGAWIGAGLVCLVGVAGFARVVLGEPLAAPASFALAGVVAVALTPLVVRALRGALANRLRWLAAALVLAAAYFGWHAVFEHLVALPSGASAMLGLRVAIVVLVFGLTFAVHVAMEVRPNGRIARTLYGPLFAGLYLDELFTRLTFRVWPARRVEAPPPPQTLTLESPFAGDRS
ncbi:MAG: NADH-quinone oxidoreductase subunit L [Myxococcota bacterium]